MATARRVGWTILSLALIAGAARADELSRREVAYGDRLAERLGGGAAEVERVRRPGATGVRVSVPGATAERLRFGSPAEAQAFARGLALGEAGLVEVRGDQVLVARGPRLADAAAAEAVRASGWEVLPAPAGAPTVARDLGAPGRSGRGASADRGADRGAAPAAAAARDAHGAAELLRHHLMGEELRALRPGADAAARGAGAAPVAPRDAVAAAAAEASPAAMGAHQRDRVLPAYDALSAEDQRAFDALLARHAGEPAVRDQLLRALTAGSPVDEIAWLAGELAGKDPAWIAANTRLTATDAGPGVMQQFQDSCAATTVQALRGEYDPVYALRTRQGNADVTDAPADGNATFAHEQRAILETHGGVAVPRGERGGDGLGDGPWLDALHGMNRHTGLRFEQVGGFDDPIDPERAISLLEEHLGQGRVVPLGISDPIASGGHAIMATSVRRDAKGQPEFLIFDPWDGRSEWVAAERIRSQKLNIAGWNLLDTVMVPRAGA